MSTSVNTQKFSDSIKKKRSESGLGLRALASEIGISASTLSRVEQGNLPDIDTYLKLCNWLEVSSNFFINEKLEKESSQRRGVIAHLRADKTLPADTAKALIQMINLAYESATKKEFQV